MFPRATASHRLVRRVGQAAIALANRAVPRDPKLSVIIGWPDLEDQTLALLSGLAGTRRAVVLVEGGLDIGALSLPAEVAKKASLKGVWLYLRAREVYFTHGAYGSYRPPRNKVVVNVWHGSPIKRIGRDAGRETAKSTYAIATSPLFQAILTRAWAIPLERVFVTGLPRNDRLIRSAGAYQRPATPNNVVWLPTFRQAVRGDITLDGTEACNPFQLPGVAVSDVDRMFGRLGMRCWIKTHPMAPVVDAFVGDNVVISANQGIDADGISLYERLGQADILITDASSVWVDFLILDRPIVFCWPDHSEYEETRGTYLLDMGVALPGPVVESLASLEQALRQVASSGDRYGIERRTLARRFHTYTDANSTQRIIDRVRTPHSRSLV